MVALTLPIFFYFSKLDPASRAWSPISKFKLILKCTMVISISRLDIIKFIQTIFSICVLNLASGIPISVSRSDWISSGSIGAVPTRLLATSSDRASRIRLFASGPSSSVRPIANLFQGNSWLAGSTGVSTWLVIRVRPAFSGGPIIPTALVHVDLPNSELVTAGCESVITWLIFSLDNGEVFLSGIASLCSC
jgi:hypothetical protein